MPNETPPQEPLIYYPSPVITDRVLVETWTTEAANASPLDYGTPHPNTKKYSGFIYVRDKPIEGTLYWVHRFWVSDPSAENTYNFEIAYSGEDITKPIFAREYLIRRVDYAPIATLTTLSGVQGVRVTAGGTGYDATTTVSFSGTGTGATAEAIVFRGEVVGIVVISEGSGYTAAPTVTIAGTGTGATATSIIQPAGAVLVSQKLDRDRSDPTDSVYVRVSRIYETLPGPWLPFTRYDDQLGPIQGRRRAVVNTGQAASLSGLTKTTYEAKDGSSIVSWEIEESPTSLPGPLLSKPGYDEETNTAMHTTRQVVAVGTAVPALSTSGTTNLIVDAYYEPINAAYGTMVITYLDALPAPRIEADSIGFQFPGMFSFLGGWTIPAVCSIEGPYAGVNFTLTAPRSASRPAETTISYQFGTPTLPATWIVSSPGAASRLFPIGQNTIHNAISMTQTCTAGSQLLEDLPASDPASYTPGASLIIRASYKSNWKGYINEKRVTTITEV